MVPKSSHSHEPKVFSVYKTGKRYNQCSKSILTSCTGIKSETLHYSEMKLFYFSFHLRFELDLANNLEVEFLVYSWDPQLRHRLCYRSSLRLAALFGKGQTFQQVALRMHPAGTLYLTLRFTDMREAYDRSSSRLGNPAGGIGISPVVPNPSLVPRSVAAPGGPGGIKNLFGRELDTVLEREAAGFAVPLIVKRCTDEVEKRGLDIIGIYRLCGSETKKQMLRESFEESPELVDLSSENVPDINVITGEI